MNNNFITLASDWGADDGSGSVAEAHAAILGINPEAKIIDMSHQIKSYNVRHGAMLLMTQHRTYPYGTIFVMVVDPEVGTDRKRILMKTVSGYYFIGPNNGVLSWVLRKEKIKTVVNVTKRKYFRRLVSSGFEGRDVFAPVAAHLSRGVAIEEFGEEIDPRDIYREEYPLFKTPNKITGEILFIDKFGNITTSIEGPGKRLPPMPFVIKVGNAKITTLSHTFADSKRGQPVAFFSGVFGHLLDIAVYEGNAAENLGVEVGDKIIIERKQ